ncbi:glycosyltransferase family 2 protein [Streptomyces sp. NPDC046712]|uniref:glycosyltransferase family 2 protein n=1 Tax=Streptomyces sp. NPDC046712 TaxID=3154802 RepID=UPI0033FD6BB5
MSNGSHPLRRSTDHQPEADTRTVSLVVPVRPGDRDTGWLLDQLPAEVREVVLVGHASGDSDTDSGTRTGHGTVSVRRLGPWNCEAGDIPHAGLLAARGDHIVLMGADGTMSPKEIPHYLHYLESGYDFVKGSRFIAGGDFADYPLLRRLGHSALLRLARQLYGQHLTDLWFGFCAFRRGFVNLLELREDGVELGAELVTHALHYGLRIAEVPSLELPHRHGPSRARTVRDGTRILGRLLDERPHNALIRLTPRARPQKQAERARPA